MVAWKTMWSRPRRGFLRESCNCVLWDGALDEHRMKIQGSQLERKGLEQQGEELRLGPGSWRLPAPAAMGLLNGVDQARGASGDCDLVRAPPERLQLLSSIQS